MYYGDGTVVEEADSKSGSNTNQSEVGVSKSLMDSQNGGTVALASPTNANATGERLGARRKSKRIIDCSENMAIVDEAADDRFAGETDDSEVLFGLQMMAH